MNNNKMKALVLENIGNLELEERDIYDIKDNEVLLKIKNCGICSSDIERVFVNGTYHFPTIPGHEFSGEIVKVNSNDNNLLHKKAAVFPLLPCFKCEFCQKGEYAQCKNYNYFGSRCDGAYAEYLAVPKWNLVLFEKIDYDVAALCEPSSVALHAIKRANIKDNNSKIFVLGSGTIGLIIALMLKEMGHDVYVGVRNKKHMDFLNKINLKYIDTNNSAEYLKKYELLDGFNYVFEAVGSNDSISQAINFTKSFGTLVLIGNPKDDLHIEKNIYWKILRKQLTLTGTWNSSYNELVNDWKEALKFLENHNQVFKDIITNKFSLNQSEEAFKTVMDKSIFSIKVMFDMESR